MRQDTKKILLAAALMLIAAILALVTVSIAGGIGKHGPHSGVGWIGLMICLPLAPMGGILLLLGSAKWIADRKQEAIAEVR